MITVPGFKFIRKKYIVNNFSKWPKPNRTRTARNKSPNQISGENKKRKNKEGTYRKISKGNTVTWAVASIEKKFTFKL